MRQPDPAEILTRLGGDLGNANVLDAEDIVSLCSLTAFLLLPATLYADGLSAVKSCETDSSPPEDIARLAILPNGQSRGSDTAATLITMAKQHIEALQWAMLCQFDTKEQEAIRRNI